MNKNRFLLLILLLTFSANELCAEGRVLEKRVISSPVAGCRDIYSMDLFIDNEKNTFVRVNDFLYVNNSWRKMGEYGSRLNGFLKDGRFYMAFIKDGNIGVYTVKKDFELTSRIKIIDVPNFLWRWTEFERIFPVLGEDNSYFLQGHCGKFPTNPFEFIFCCTSGGHGITYNKPVLAEVQDDKMLRYRKFRYRGRFDESFDIKETAAGENSINFLGFRHRVEPAMGPKHPPQPVILYYADYNLKKKRVTRSHTIYEDTPRFDNDIESRLDYGPLSMDSFGDNVFIAFTWFAEGRMVERKEFDIRNVKSNIYYVQLSEGRFGDIETIGEGFSPIVRADFSGNVYIIWVDSNGNFLHKARKNDGWSEAKVILSNVDIYPVASYLGYICAEFDKDNNLNIICPSNNNLIYAKIKLD
jgi:hypothetical protein